MEVSFPELFYYYTINLLIYNIDGIAYDAKTLRRINFPNENYYYIDKVDPQEFVNKGWSHPFYMEIEDLEEETLSDLIVTLQYSNNPFFASEPNPQIRIISSNYERSAKAIAGTDVVKVLPFLVPDWKPNNNISPNMYPILNLIEPERLYIDKLLSMDQKNMQFSDFSYPESLPQLTPIRDIVKMNNISRYSIDHRLQKFVGNDKRVLLVVDKNEKMYYTVILEKQLDLFEKRFREVKLATRGPQN